MENEICKTNKHLHCVWLVSRDWFYNYTPIIWRESQETFVPSNKNMGSMRGLAKVPYQLDELLPEQLDAFLDSGRVPLTDETTCGYGIFRGKCLQR